MVPVVPLYYRIRAPLKPSTCPLVFIHGLDSASDTFSKVIERLGSRFPCFALDLRGHGRSPFPLDEPDFSLATMMGDVQAFLKTTGIDKVVLVGHSMGARVCIPLSRLLGERCSGLVIEDMDLEPRQTRDVSPSVLASLKSFKPRHSTPEDVITELGKYGYEKARVEAWLREGGRIFKDEDDYVIGIHPLVSTLEVNSLLATDDAAEAFSQIAEDPNRPPVLLFKADINPACKRADRMISMLPSLEVVTIPGSVHSVHSSHLDEYCERITRFMDKVGSNDHKA